MCRGPLSCRVFHRIAGRVHFWERAHVVPVTRLPAVGACVRAALVPGATVYHTHIFDGLVIGPEAKVIKIEADFPMRLAAMMLAPGFR